MIKKLLKKIHIHFLADKYSKKIAGVIANAESLDPTFSAILISNLYDDFEDKKRAIEEVYNAE